MERRKSYGVEINVIKVVNSSYFFEDEDFLEQMQAHLLNDTDDLELYQEMYDLLSTNAKTLEEIMNISLKHKKLILKMAKDIYNEMGDTVDYSNELFYERVHNIKTGI